MDPDPPPIDAETLDAQRTRMRRLARSLVRDYDRADDVVQETCLKALTGTVRPRRSVRACLSGVARSKPRRVSERFLRAGCRVVPIARHKQNLLKHAQGRTLGPTGSTTNRSSPTIAGLQQEETTVGHELRRPISTRQGQEVARLGVGLAFGN